MNGLEAAREILGMENPPLILFATAYDKHAVGAFEMGAIDYILKPFEDVRIDCAISRIKKLKSQSKDWFKAVEQLRSVVNGHKSVNRIGLEKNGRIAMVNYCDILYAEANSKTATVVAKQQDYVFNGTLSELELRLKESTFMRIHRSYIVNLEHVTGVIPWFKGTYWLELNNKEELRVPVSKNLVRSVKDALNIA